MRRLSIILLAALLASTAACRMQNSSRTALVIGGAAIAAGGVAVASQGGVDADNSGQNDFLLDDNFGAYFLGTAMVIGGLVMLVGGATAQPTDGEDRWKAAQVPAPAPPILATSPVMLPGLAVNGALVTSSVTPLTVDLAGWTIGQPYIVKGRTHLTAIADATKLEMVLQRVVRPVSAEEVVARLDLSAYGPVARRVSSIGAVPAVELVGATSDTVPVLVAVAVAEQQLLSIVCHGATPTCRDAIARATWN